MKLFFNKFKNLLTKYSSITFLVLLLITYSFITFLFDVPINQIYLSLTIFIIFPIFYVLYVLVYKTEIKKINYFLSFGITFIGFLLLYDFSSIPYDGDKLSGYEITQDEVNFFIYEMNISDKQDVGRKLYGKVIKDENFNFDINDLEVHSNYKKDLFGNKNHLGIKLVNKKNKNCFKFIKKIR